MTVALVILGMLLGGSLHGFSGALLGGVAGYAIGILHSLKQKLHGMENEIAELRQLSKSRGSETAGMAETAKETPAAAAYPGEIPPEPISPDQSFAFEQRGEAACRKKEAAATAVEQQAGKPETPAPGGKYHAFTHPLVEKLNSFITGGSLLVKVGIVILFFGVSFLVKYAAEHELLPIELRLSGAAFGGIVLLLVGWRLRQRRDIYAQVLQGGGIGILYLTTFAALRLYSLIPHAFAFFVLVSVALLSAILAVLQNARALAVIGVSGGFLAPVLTSTGGGSHVILFSYYALLNCGIIGIAWFRAWRVLNLFGFAFTFVIGGLWGYRYYQPEYFSTTEPFLVLFFSMYVAIAILFALRQEPDLKGYLDGTLVFGTPIVTFALQGMLVRQHQYGLAWSALIIGLIYMPLAWVLFLKKSPHMRTLIEAFFAFGVVFATLAIPLTLENRWTSAAWALEGAGILWAGTRQRKTIARSFGIFLLFAAGIAFLADAHRVSGGIPVLNSYFLGCVLLACSGIFAALCLHRQRENVGRLELIIGIALFVWGLLWWFGGGLSEIDRHMSRDFRMGSILMFFAITCSACDYLERRLAWTWASWPALLLLPLLYCTSLAVADGGLHPFSQAGYIAWPVAFAAFYRILHHHEWLHGDIRKGLHAGALWLLAWLLAMEMHWQGGNLIDGADTWSQAAWGLAPAIVILIISKLGQKVRWPVRENLGTYLSLGAGPVALAAWLWVLYANMTSAGDSYPLRYLPFLNPLDVTICIVFTALTVWFMSLRSAYPDSFTVGRIRVVLGGYAASLFIWINAILVRTIHQWSGIEFSLSPLFHSVLLQASFSIFWSLLALCTMVIATRRGLRTAWLAGAGLLVMVVVKLFLVDLSNTGSVERIVSFVGVGILLLIIGYVSPVPPRTEKEDQP